MVFILIYLRLKAKLTSVINFLSDKEKSSCTLSHIQLGIKNLSEDVVINGSIYSNTRYKNISPGKVFFSKSFSYRVSLVLHQMICIFREISCLQWAPVKTRINCFLTLFFPDFTKLNPLGVESKSKEIKATTVHMMQTLDWS